MKQEEIDEKIQIFQTDHIKWVEENMLKNGGIGPLIAVLALNTETDVMGIVFAPIMGSFDEDDKKDLINRIIPHLFDEIKEKNLKPYCFSFCSEVLMRHIDTKNKEIDSDNLEEFIPKNWKDLPATEALLISFETKELSKNFVFNMERIGKAINDDGKMVDNIKLVPADIGEKGNETTMTGRFANIFKKYHE